MNAANTELKLADAVVSAPFFLRGELCEGEDAIHRSRDLGVAFATPRIALDRVVHPRTQVPPLLNVPLAEIIDFLVETGQRIRDPNNPFMRECVDRMTVTHVLPRAVLAASGGGEVNIRRLIGGLAATPLDLIALLRLARRYRAATRSLIAVAGARVA